MRWQLTFRYAPPNNATITGHRPTTNGNTRITIWQHEHGWGAEATHYPDTGNPTAICGYLGFLTQPEALRWVTRRAERWADDNGG